MERMTEHDMIGWFNAAPMGSRQQRMLWAAHKIARLTGATEGNVYQTLERSLERAGPPPSGSSVQRQRRVAPGRLGSLAISRSRQQDKLPTDRRRNASERRVDESSDGADGRPTIKTRDRLLKRLIAVHGEPRFDFVQLEETDVFVSQPVDGVIYVARKSLKGSAKFLWSAIEVASDQNDRRVDVEG
jgi:hypothetical protein